MLTAAPLHLVCHRGGACAAAGARAVPPINLRCRPSLADLAHKASLYTQDVAVVGLAGGGLAAAYWLLSSSSADAGGGGSDADVGAGRKARAVEPEEALQRK